MTASPLVTSAAALAAGQPVGTYREAVRVPTLSVGLFRATDGHDDVQSPHVSDEVYVVVTGEAVLVVDGERTDVAAGSVAHVPAGVPHRFEDVRGDLQVVVVFAPPLP